MPLFSETKNAIGSYFEAYRFVKANQLGKIIFYSCVAYLVLFLLSGWLLWLGLEQVSACVLESSWVKNKLAWLYRYDWIMTSTKIGLFLSGLFFYLSVFKFVFLAIASPMYAFISETTAEILNQTQHPFSTKQFLHDVYRGIRISVINLMRQLFFTLTMMLLSFIPVIGWVFNIIILWIDAYYYGFSMIDYNCERHNMSVAESRKFIASHKGMALGNGLVAVFSLFVPLVGIIIMAPLSAIAATLHFYKKYPNV
jgi:CysZ protein